MGDDMEGALIAQDRVLRSRVKAASSPHAARRIRAGIVFVLCATALFGVLLVSSCNGDNTMNGPTPQVALHAWRFGNQPLDPRLHTMQAE